MMGSDWSPPPRPEASVWLGVFNQRLAEWSASQGTDEDAAAGLVDALRHLLERAPDYGGTVATLATNLLHQNARALRPLPRRELAEVGLAAERLLGERRPLTRAWLTVERGGASFSDGRYLDAARDAQAALSALPAADGELTTLLRAKALALRGSAHDALLDYAGALERYRSATDLAAGLADDELRLASLVDDVIVQLFGDRHGMPSEAIQAELELLWRELSELRIACAVGAARCAAFVVPAKLADELKATREALRSHGLADVSPLELGILVRRAPAAVAGELAAEIVAVADAVDVPSADFAAVLYAAACCAADAADAEELEAAAIEAVEVVEDVLHAAATIGFLFTAAARRDRGDADDAREAFLTLLGLLRGSRDGRLDDPRLRAAFDEPVALALGVLASALEEPAGSPSRIELARLIDFELGGRSALDRWLPVPDETALEPAALLAQDRLTRVQRALREWPGTTALILRASGSGQMMLGLSSDGSVTVETAPASYAQAEDALVAALDYEVQALSLTHVAAGEEAFLDLGRAAYDALPAAVRRQVEASDVLLVCPDHRTGGDAVPYELFHDGAGWLGTRKVIARLPSLRALVRTCERTARRNESRRLLALAVADPELEGYPLLGLAEGEAEGVRELLADRGWDAPPIDPARIDGEFVLERLPYVAHVHIAAHGETEAGEDELLLTGGSTLTSTDLAARLFPRVPSAYVNACSLGAARWVGGGKSRGVAQTLLEAGSPAVVANLLPVEDEVSSQLARRLYREAADVDLGEALRRARAELESSASPLLWGSTVLIGDPRTTLAPAERDPSLSERLLEALFVGTAGPERDAVRAEAMVSLGADPDDVRLAASAALLHEVAGWGAQPRREDRGRIAAGCRVAFELDYLPAAALIAFALVETHDDADDPHETMSLLEGVIGLVEPLEHDAPLWKSLLDRVLVRWMLLRQGDRAPAISVRNAPAGEEDELVMLGETIRDAQLAQDARAFRQRRSAAARDAGDGVEDVLWNAVLANREVRLESMPEVAAFARQVSDRLAGLGAVAEESRPYAATAIAGLVKFLWDSQNVVQLAPEIARGQAGTLAELVASLGRNWPPRPAPWFEPVAGLGESVTATLAVLDGLPYDDQLYPAIGRAMERIETDARAALDAVAAADPDRQPDAMAWVLGVLIERNTYSWTEGSVPEHLQTKLEEIHGRIAGSAEGVFFPWLMAGYREVREAEPDELERWRLGLVSA